MLYRVITDSDSQFESVLRFMKSEYPELVEGVSRRYRVLTVHEPPQDAINGIHSRGAQLTSDYRYDYETA
jgi:hypothetical protein